MIGFIDCDALPFNLKTYHKHSWQACLICLKMTFRRLRMPLTFDQLKSLFRKFPPATSAWEPWPAGNLSRSWPSDLAKPLDLWQAAFEMRCFKQCVFWTHGKQRSQSRRTCILRKLVETMASKNQILRGCLGVTVGPTQSFSEAFWVWLRCKSKILCVCGLVKTCAKSSCCPHWNEHSANNYHWHSLANTSSKWHLTSKKPLTLQKEEASLWQQQLTMHTDVLCEDTEATSIDGLVPQSL